MQRQFRVIFLILAWLALPSAWGADRGALFKVSAHGHTMYLFGTIHVGAPGFYPLEPRILVAVADASALVVEVDLNRNPAGAASLISRHGILPAGRTLYQGMTPALKGRVDKLLTRAGIPPDAVARLKPWLVVTMLAMAEYGIQGYSPAFSVDAHLSRLARDSKVPLTELESIEGQVSVFSSLKARDQMRLLEDLVTQLETGEEGAEVRQVIAAWTNADRAGLDAIAQQLEEDKSFSGRFFQKVLLEERNVKMAARLAPLLAKQDKSVVAVGILHLVGTKSIPALLRARGIEVERVY